MNEEMTDRLVAAALDRELGGLEIQDLTERVREALEVEPLELVSPEMPATQAREVRPRWWLIAASILLPLGFIYGFLGSGSGETGPIEVAEPGVQDEGAAKLLARIAGRCVDAASAPIARAKIELFKVDDRANRTRLVASTLSDAAGAFAFAGIPGLAMGDIGWSFYTLLARSKGRAIGYATLRSQDQWRVRERLVLKMEAAQEVRGVVTSRDGERLPGVKVWVRWIDPFHADVGTRQLYLRAPDVELQATTDPEGRYVLGGLPAGVDLRLATSHPRYASLTQRCKAGPGGLDFELSRAAGATGRVLYPDAKPAAGVGVAAQGLTHGDFLRTRTDGDGKFTLSPLRPDRYNVWAEVEGYTVAAQEGVSLVVEERNIVPVLKLVRGGWIRGQVVDAENGLGVKPGATADVGLHGPSRPQSGAAIEVGRIAADGSFRIRVAPGSNMIYLRCGEGWKAMHPDRHTVVVKDGAEVTVKFKAARGGTPRRRR